VKALILARHGHAVSNVADTVSCVPPGDGLSELGEHEATELGERLAGEPIELGVASELRRTQETLALALDGRDVPVLVLPELNEIDFGSYEGGPLAAYRVWAWSTPADVECPGGGESRTAVARRVAAVLERLLDRPERTILAVGHALPIRYVLDGSAGRPPPARIGTIVNAEPHWIPREGVETAVATLRAWVNAPRFADADTA
jgi:ribonuclease H / adenosylcobalamin/alpha-ribazole phosphatase